MIARAAATAVFVVSLWLIFSERLNRTIVAIAGAALMVGLGKLFGSYNEPEAIAAIDFNTLGLLLGMMILVALLVPTGFFEYLAVKAGRLSQGKPLRLLVLLGTITTVLSMFLDNVTTVVLIAPVTILISEILGLSPIPFLLSEALLSNTGGVATLVGDPPNVLIGSAAGLTFNDFLTHSLPVVAAAWIIALVLLRFLFRKDLEILPENMDSITSLDPAETWNDRGTAMRVLVVLAGTLLLFFFQGSLGLTPAYIALSGAAAALVWVQPSIQETLKQVEWGVLIFFSALFVMVGGLEEAGIFHSLVSLLEHAVDIPPVMFGILTIWVVALLSAIVDNIPITIAAIPVIQGLAEAGMDVRPLWWALAFGAGFGGNGTIIGSTANIIVTSLSERTRTPITSLLWNRRGLPVMLATCTVASILFVLLFPLMSS
jgi:Na+/H+ antiporter NhaD/arsenite permease-like protein